MYTCPSDTDNLFLPIHVFVVRTKLVPNALVGYRVDVSMLYSRHALKNYAALQGLFHQQLTTANSLSEVYL